MNGSECEQNLERWIASSEPETWVREHVNGWNHDDWLELLARLRESEYWPMEEDSVGLHLEGLRDSLRAPAAE
jgi:hypothetical protein